MPNVPTKFRKASWEKLPLSHPHLYPLSTEARPLRHHWATTKFYRSPQRSFSEQSMISKVFHDVSVIFQWTLWSPWSPPNFELVQRVSQWSLREADFQWTLSDLSVSAQRSHQSFNDLSAICLTNARFLVNYLDHSVISVGRNRSVNSQWLHVGVSTNAQRSPRSLRGLRRSPWNYSKFSFGPSMSSQGSPGAFPLIQLFGGSWRLLRDLANFWSLNGFPKVSVLWKGDLSYIHHRVQSAWRSVFLRLTHRRNKFKDMAASLSLQSDVALCDAVVFTIFSWSLPILCCSHNLLHCHPCRALDVLQPCWGTASLSLSVDLPCDDRSF